MLPLPDDDEDDYSGLEDVEEDSRQLQFSFVQSSGTDPVQDVLSAVSLPESTRVWQTLVDSGRLWQNLPESFKYYYSYPILLLFGLAKTTVLKNSSVGSHI